MRELAPRREADQALTRIVPGGIIHEGFWENDDM